MASGLFIVMLSQSIIFRTSTPIGEVRETLSIETRLAMVNDYVNIFYLKSWV